MFSCECILAAALLTSGADGPLPHEASVWAESCRMELLALGLDAELVDPRERGNIFVHLQDAPKDLHTLQARFRDLAFAPLAVECQRFPDRRTIADFLAFNRGYRVDLQTRLTVDTVHSELLRVAISETDQLHHIWNTAREASCDYYYVTVRREALQLLRNLLGDEAFFRGEMPPYIPVWRCPTAR